MSTSNTTTSSTTAASTMSSKPTGNNVTSSAINEMFANDRLDKQVKLEAFIQHLQHIKSKPAADYISEARVLLHKLTVEFKGHRESYLPWVRFLDVAHIHKMNMNEADAIVFRKGVEEIVSQELLSATPNTKPAAGQGNIDIGIDWRIAAKMLSLQTHFTPYSDLESLKQGILKTLEAEIRVGLEHLLWKEETSFTDLTRKSLLCLLESYKSQDGQERLVEAVTSGRFDKGKFGLEYSLIMGEDGGLYLLLNRLSEVQQKTLLSEEIVTEEYLKDKTVKEETYKQHDKVVLGKGGFGTVKFALSLFNSRSLPAEVVCIKKTRSFKQLVELNRDTFISPLKLVTESTLGDYFTNDRAQAIYSPIIFDMALIHSKSVISEDSERDHRKGYLMMEIMPQNTATRIFADKQYQNWGYQKPYLLDVLKNTQKLLESDIAMTDLKPDNTLYDTDIRKATIIDLGGSIKVESAKELAQFDLTKYPFQSTPGYRAPEMERSEGVVDVKKLIAYTCGMVIKEITEKSDYAYPQDISALVQKLTASPPESRISIPEAIKELEHFGDDSYKQSIIFSHYISKVKDRLQNRKSAISINEDIDATRELYIALDTTPLDPLKYKNMQTQDLFQKINDFLSPQSKKQVMAIFGAAGSGKSIALQLKFIEAVQAWQPSKPLPIYFNLAGGTDLDQILRALNTELGTDLKIENLSGQHLYIDSFDEGLGIEHKREGLIKDYYQKIGSISPPKILITCRTDYLSQDDNWQKWFSPPTALIAAGDVDFDGKPKDRLEVCYVAPLNYKGLDQKLPDMVKKYVDHYQKSHPHQQTYHTTQDYLNKIRELQVLDLIDTGFMFFLVLEVLFRLKRDESVQRHINKLDIYASYVAQYQSDQTAKLIKSQDQKKKVHDILSFIHHHQTRISCQAVEEQKKEEEEVLVDTNTCVQELGNFIANQLHLRNQSRLDESHKLFAAFDFDDSHLLRHQSIYQILRLLPLKIETTQSANRLRLDQEVKIGFRHDTLKNYYLLEAIKSEIKRDGKSLILASKSITDDKELVKMIVLAVQYSPMLINALNEAIINSKKDKSMSSVTYASNSITILVAARYSFSGHDLSDIAVKGADLTHSIFYKTKLERADLSNALMRNVNLVEATLDGADMRGVNLEILPHIKVYSEVNSVSFSPDGKLLVSSSEDQTITLWYSASGERLHILEGHEGPVKSVNFSPDGKLLVSGSSDKTIKVWNPTSAECLQTLEEHNDEVTSVSFSSDSKLLVSSSSDRTIKLWNLTSGKCIRTLQGHEASVTSASFSRDGKLLASGSIDSTVKLWDPISGECLHTLQGDNRVTSVSFSPDGKLLVSGSWGGALKVWNPTSGECLYTLEGHNDNVHNVSFSPDGKLVVSCSSDSTIKLWNATSGECLHTLQGHDTFITDVRFSPDGKLLVSGSWDKTIKLWNPTSSECLHTLQGHHNQVTDVTFSSDGKLLASSSFDSTIKLWNPISGEHLSTLQGQNYPVTSVSFSPDGKQLASSSMDKTIKLWNPTSGECLHALKGHKDNVESVCFSPDGKLLASCSEDNTIKLWDPTSGECLHTLKGHNSFITSVSFSPDSQLLVSGSWDNTIKLWNPISGECLRTLEGHDRATSVSFSPDGKLLASGSGDGTIQLWDPVSAQCLRTLEAHSDNIQSVCFSPDGKLLASGSEDKTIKVWNPTSGDCLHTLKGHDDVVTSVSFSPDGQLLVSGSGDKTIKIFQKDPNSQTWFLKHNITDVLSPLNGYCATLKSTKISTLNRRIFGQNMASIESCEIDETLPPSGEINIVTLHAADQVSRVFLNTQLNSQQGNRGSKDVKLKSEHKKQIVVGQNSEYVRPETVNARTGSNCCEMY